MRLLIVAFAASALLTAPAVAAQCKDPKTGKFVKCPPAAAVKSIRCKDAKGKFVKCGTPGAKPI